MSIQERTPADNYGSVEQPHLEQPSRKCCKIKYRVRYFYSKGAFLVLLWMTLISMTVLQFNNDLVQNISKAASVSYNHHSEYWYLLVVLVFASIPLVGWLADTKLGNYKVFKTGAIILFLAAIVRSITILVFSAIQNHDSISNGIIAAVQIIICSVGITGIATCIITALQLGLDQMPDASAENITSFIAWFVFSTFGSFWMSNSLLATLTACTDLLKDVQILTIDCLMPSVCMAIVSCTIFLLALRYLVVEPKSPQSLKTIYRVLKFACNHKAPLNRSAFTYWEENIPSRFDLGKSKYGGPFTTEQVEDVKTFFKMLVISIPVIIVFSASNLSYIILHLPMPFIGTSCTSHLIPTFTFDMWWAIATATYEFGIYPFVRNMIPSTLKRIGITAFLVSLIRCLSLTDSLIDYYFDKNTTNVVILDFFVSYQNYKPWIALIVYFSSGLVTIFFHQWSTGVCVCSVTIQHARTADWLYNVLVIFFNSTEQFIKQLAKRAKELQCGKHDSKLDTNCVEFDWIHPSLCPGSLVQEESER